MLLFAFFAMAVLHFGGIITLPLWLVFTPLIAWIVITVTLAAIVIWAKY